jgi:hypothetical protein
MGLSGCDFGVLLLCDGQPLLSQKTQKEACYFFGL